MRTAKELLDIIREVLSNEHAMLVSGVYNPEWDTPDRKERLNAWIEERSRNLALALGPDPEEWEAVVVVCSMCGQSDTGFFVSKKMGQKIGRRVATWPFGYGETCDLSLDWQFKLGTFPGQPGRGPYVGIDGICPKCLGQPQEEPEP